MIQRLFASCLATLVLTAAAAPAIAATPDCEYSLSDVAGAPRFEDYPAGTRQQTPPAKPLLTSRDARLYRTMIRESAASGPNFAGHYTVAVWGCGTSCSDFAIIDAKSGRVFFDNRLRGISSVHADVRIEPNGALPTFNSLRFRPDSRLLIMLGAPAEDEARDGVAFYMWTGSTLKLLRFVSRTSICDASH